MTRVCSILEITENIYLFLCLCTRNFISGYKDDTGISNFDQWLFHILDVTSSSKKSFKMSFKTLRKTNFTGLQK